jgi:peptidoglycan hydrolase CwlO-like protein
LEVGITSILAGDGKTHNRLRGLENKVTEVSTKLNNDQDEIDDIKEDIEKIKKGLNKNGIPIAKISLK